METVDEADPARGRYVVLGLLLAMNTLLYLDKIVLTILLEPIKAEFGATDLELGVLAGLVYAIFMGLGGLPLGWLADRVSRRNLAAGCLAVWSVMTGVCGLATSYGQLLLGRVGVGVGEAGGGPAAVSIIADLFEHRRRSSAMAIFALASPASALINLSVNTQIVHAFGWRAALIGAAVPGLVLAAIMLAFMREPVRTGVKETPPPLGQTLRFLAGQRSLVLVLAGALVCYVVLAGISSWHFSFLVRTYHISLKTMGPVLGVSIAGAGVAGHLLSGFAADRLGRVDERWRVWVMAATTLMSVGLGYGAFLAKSWTMALLFGALFSACSSIWLAPALAISQSLARPRMRATVGAVLFLMANLVGYGAGPPIAGFLSDLFTARGSAQPLRDALVCMASANLLAVLLFAASALPLRRDLERAGSLA